ncbi:MAG: cob(I)yrinic acid a,c-diamide adenosyltransferase [Chlorobi bacterium]|nr:cob(I)yrinic acid a,c-diamide adenosyltransferase [Chlorobiota bacterium]
MKIYTKTGDKGTTQLIGGTRVPKHHLRIEAYGTLDELMSFLGLLRDHLQDDALKKEIVRIQNDLFTLGTFIAIDPEKAVLKNGKPRVDIPDITAAHIAYLEQAIDRMNEQLPPMTAFILPGGHPAVSVCHIARTVCRRAERRMTALYEVSPFDDKYLKYVNRLSDYLFVLARKLMRDFGTEEIPWDPKNK